LTRLATAQTEPGETLAVTASDASVSPPDDDLCLFCEPRPGSGPHGIRGLHWHDHWTQVGAREYATVGVLTATYATLTIAPEDPSEPRWARPILFDTAVRGALVSDSRSTRDAMGTASDAFFYASFLYPVVVDNLIVTWIGRQAPGVAWQMAIINAQAYSLTLTLTEAVKLAVARERPYVDECAQDPNYTANCGGGGRFRSFFSGHGAITATGAALVCAHHTQLELYKNGVADAMTCGAAVAISLGTGALRMSSDNHWATDVAMGYLVGYTSGYLLPTLLYYHDFRIKPEGTGVAGAPKFTILPAADATSVRLNMIGEF
jgi:membrane-associated phospholipid phosphatase